MNDASMHPGRSSAFVCIAAALLGLCSIFTLSVHAQTAQFLIAQSILVPGLTAPSNITVDGAGNLYITDRSNQLILKETPNANGGYRQTVIASGLNSPGQVAVDTSGNVYICDTDNHRVLKESLYRGFYTQSTFGSGFVTPKGIAIDSSGSIYIGDGGLAYIVKETPSQGTFVKTSIGQGMSEITSVAVDSKGNVYVAEAQNYQVLKETLSNGSYTQSSIGNGLYYPECLIVDGFGVVYIADTFNGRVLKETPSGAGYVQSELPTATSLTGFTSDSGAWGVAVDGYGNVLIADTANGRILKISQTGADFGPVLVGTTSPVVKLMFNFSAGGTLNNLLTLTQGASGMDFTNAGTGSCLGGSLYSVGTQCTFDVTFSPQYAGDRDGAVLLRNTSQQTFVTGYLHGVGRAAQMNYLAGVQKSIPYVTSGQASPYGVAVDGYGTIFIADSDNNVVRREFPVGNTYFESIVGSGMSSPTALAVDAAGNLFIADTYNGRVLKLTPYGHGLWSQSVLASGLADPYGVAVGPDGAVYIADSYNDRVLRETPSGNSYAQSVVPIINLAHPYGLAVDGHGNLYVSDVSNEDVLKVSLLNGKYSQSFVAGGVSGIFGIAVDSLGSVYMALFNNAEVVRYTASGNSWVGSNVPLAGIANPYAVALDAQGNVYVADVGNEVVTEADFGDAPSLTFASTAVNSTSSDSPKVVTIQDFGNLPLNLAVPTSGQNPSVSTNFSVAADPANPCPIIDSAAASPGTLTPGQSCELDISFTPTTSGNIDGSLVFTDDALTPSAPGTSQQTIALSGVGATINTQLTWATPAAITYGKALSATQLDATASDGSNPIAGIFVYSPAAGKVLGAGSKTLSVTFTPTNTADYSSASGSVALTVQKAVLTVTAKAASKTYGAANPAFTYTITGFVNGDTAAAAVTGLAKLTTTAATGSPAGAYPVTASIGTLASTNYSFKFVNSSLTVSKASLTITANNASVAYNKPLPTLTYKPTGFVNGDTAAVLTGAPTETTTATVGSAPGAYPIKIVAGTLAAANYNFTLKNGTLTITALGTAATPVFAPAGGTYAVAQNVTLTDSTAGKVIYYTTNGTTPTAASTKYTAAIHVGASETIKAIAIAPGYNNSVVATAAYTIN